MGRPPKTTEAQRQIIRARLVKGETVMAVARDFKVSRATVLTVRENAGSGLPNPVPLHLQLSDLAPGFRVP